MASRPWQVAGWIATKILYGVWVALMIATPLFGFWLASSLAAFGDWILDGHDGPIANGVRGALLGFADHFEKRWHTADTTYGTSDKPPDPTEHEHDTPPTIIDVAKPIQPVDPNGWPLPAEV